MSTETGTSYLVFRIGKSFYALPSLLIDEITLLPEITPILDAPKDILGLIIWRSKVISIIDLRKRLNANYFYRVQNSLIIIKYKGFHVGLVVDEVIDNIENTEETVVEGVGILNPPFSKMVERVFRHEHRLIGILSVEQVIDCPEEIKEFLESVTEDSIGNFYDQFMLDIDPQAKKKFSERTKALAESIIDSSFSPKKSGDVPAVMVEINGSLWLISLSWVREFLVLDNYHLLPFSSPPVVGVCNLRGEIIPLLSWEHEFNYRSKILVAILEKDIQVLGLLIQGIHDLIYYGLERVKKESMVQYSMGSVVCEDKIARVLDFDQLLTRR